MPATGEYGQRPMAILMAGLQGVKRKRPTAVYSDLVSLLPGERKMKGDCLTQGHIPGCL